MWIWILLSLLCSISWGIAYSLQSILSQTILPYTLNCMYCSIVAVVSFVILVFTNQIENIHLLINKPTNWMFLLYVLLVMVPSFVIMFTFKLAGDNASTAVAISSIYPLFTLLTNYFFMEQRDISITGTCVGASLIVAGIIVITVSNRS